MNNNLDSAYRFSFLDNSKNIKTLIFDCDGLLVDSELLQFEARRLTAIKFGLVLTELDFLFFWFDGNGGTKAFCKKYNLDFEKFDSQKSSLYKDFIEKRLKLCTGVESFLNKVKNHFKIALCSNSSRTDLEMILHKFSFRDYFDTVISGIDLQHGKPDPEGFLLAAKRTQSLPEECLVFENSHIGLEAAKSAGMSCVIIPDIYGGKFKFTAADKVVERINEVEFI